MTASTELGACYAAAMEAARAAGQLLLDSLGKLRQSQVRAKGISDYVTDLDKAAERLILKIIQKRFPDHGVMAEESGQANSKSPYRWIIDPLDGTTNYIHQFPAFCVSIGLSRENELQVGVIYDPLRDELFHAVRGQGAFCNRTPIRVASCPGLNEALIATGFPYRIGQRLDPYLESFRQVFLNCSGIRRAG
ncbi:MAG: inositol monophosphatase, partial [Candidatus Omnitrophica bacterium]|nr:inositol monophosphatase [Candidatus Omnitrophota bacterium]